MAVALDPQGNGGSAAWNNPETKHAGAFSPSTRPFVQEDRVCRGFTAALDLGEGDVREINGAACRHSGGIWRIDRIDDSKEAKI